jgi:flagellar protein FliO/FliZ
MDVTDIIRYFGALALVLALVGAAGFAIRRFGVPGIAGGKGRRLAIVESLMLGSRHRLFLVRCDSTEHVLVLTPQGATLVNSSPAPRGVQPAAGDS